MSPEPVPDERPDLQTKPPLTPPGRQRVKVYDGIFGKGMNAEVYLTGEFPSGVTSAHIAKLRKLLESQEELFGTTEE